MISINSRKGKGHPQQSVNASIKKGMKYFEPKCASDRYDVVRPKTIEQAYKEMLKTQERFIAQREKIRVGLNTTCCYRDEVCYSESPKPGKRVRFNLRLNGKGYVKSPELYRKTLTPARKYLKKVNEKVLNLDSFIEGCEEIKEQNKVIGKRLPIIGKFFYNSFQKMDDKVISIQEEYMGKSNYQRSLRKFNRHLVDLFDFNAL